MEDQRGPAIRSLAEGAAPRRHWRHEHRETDESAGTWYFECVLHEGEWWCIRQVAPHAGGVSVYDWEHLRDDHGFLTDQPLEDDAPVEPITADEFDAAWREAARGLNE